MKALFTALAVSVVFAGFFVLFLVVPALVILVGYVVMVQAHKRRSRRARANAQAPPPETPALHAGAEPGHGTLTTGSGAA